MKDYYDLWLILGTFEFDGMSLKMAIETTFRTRATEIPDDRPESLSDEYARARQTHWINFLNKMDLQNDQVADFSNVLEQIWDFLKTPLQASINKTKSNMKWKPGKGWK